MPSQPRSICTRSAIAAAAVAIGLAACSRAPGNAPISGADPERGRLLVRQFGCGACHLIPGVPLAHGNVGPSLERVARQVYLAGVLPNSPDNLVRWIRFPQQISPPSAMPQLNISEAQARDIAAYLLTLE
ncbi:MAG TPA: c-type cytochrome [Burkholderiaceae bacterium]|nr:c-type cytochrome [Burkholderiaceae bacterium]